MTSIIGDDDDDDDASKEIDCEVDKVLTNSGKSVAGSMTVSVLLYRMRVTAK